MKAPRWKSVACALSITVLAASAMADDGDLAEGADEAEVAGEGTGVGNGVTETPVNPEKTLKCRSFKPQNPGSAGAEGMIDQFAEEMDFDHLRDGQTVTVDTRVTYSAQVRDGRVEIVQSRQETGLQQCTRLEGEATVQESAAAVASRTEEASTTGGEPGTSTAEAGTSDEGESDEGSTSTSTIAL